MYSSFSYSPLDQQDALLASLANPTGTTANDLMNQRKGAAIQGYLAQHAKSEATRMNTELEMKKAIRNIQAERIDYTSQTITGIAVLGLVWLILRRASV